MLSSTAMSNMLLHEPVRNPLSSLSSLKPLSTSLSLATKLSHLALTGHKVLQPIRMGGGPRTYPGGVSKWQWKRMQAKKAKQLLNARLGRERQIYEMRKRAELKAAVSELERPWEAVEKPPNLFSVSADEQLKVLADRFQKPGGLDLWSERDGPQLFRPDNDEVPSSRFFPKGAVHSVKPYGKAEGEGLSRGTKGGDSEELTRKGYSTGRLKTRGNNTAGIVQEDKDGNFNEGIVEKKGYRRGALPGSVRDSRSRGRGNNAGEYWGREGSKIRNTDMFDMTLRDDGKYGFALD